MVLYRHRSNNARRSTPLLLDPKNYSIYMNNRNDKRAVFMMTAALAALLDWNRSAKRALVVAMDCVLCVVAVWIAFSLRLGEWTLYNTPILTTASVALICWYPAAIINNIYRAIFRFAGSGMMLNLLKACLMMTVPMILVLMVLVVPGVPRTMGLLQPMVFLLLLVLSRVVARYLFSDVLSQRSYRGQFKNVLIYGAGTTGQQLALSMRQEPGMRLTGFVDDDRHLHLQTMDGVRVYHSAELQKLIKRHDVTDVLLALPNVKRSEQNQIIERLESFPVHVKTLPNIAEMLDGRVSISNLRDLKIEDLLGRDEVPPNEELLDKTIAGKRVMVTGAGGSIGSELCRQIISHNPSQLIIVEMSEFALYAIDRELRATLQLDGRDTDLLVPVLANLTAADLSMSILQTYRPQTIFHAAAYKHVPLVESNPVQGVFNNVQSTWNMASAARLLGVSHFILISTDKAVRPTNVMGASKRICELILQAFAVDPAFKTKFAMVRFGNVLGSSGSVVPAFERQIRSGGPVTLTHKEITRYFMTIPEAAQLVIQAGAMAEGGEVYVLDMGQSIKIIDLAKSMIRLSGLTVQDENNPDGDIAIEEVGLRPGEKLYEELLIGDNPEATSHHRIMRASESYIPLEKLGPQMEILGQAVQRNDAEQVLSIVRLLVPEYLAPPIK